MCMVAFPLHASVSILEEAKKAAAQDGVSLNQLIGSALAGRVSVLRNEAVLLARAPAARHRAQAMRSRINSEAVPPSGE